MIINDKLKDDLIEAITGMMNHYHYNPQSADYCCEFCGRTESTSVGTMFGIGTTITHSDDCEGKRLLQELQR